MKIAVTGATGRLGSELVERHGCIPLVCDVTNPAQIKEAVQSVCPDILIHCAAYTDVDGCEQNQFKAIQVNTRSTEYLRNAFTGKFVLISTDFVFDGKSGPYSEIAQPNPINWYGLSKLAAELLLEKNRDNVIVRTTLLFGNRHKTDYVQRVRDALMQGEDFLAFSDLYGNPTYVPHLAQALLQLVSTDFSGTINICGTTWLSRYDEAVEVARMLGLDDSKVLQRSYLADEPQSDVLKQRRADRPKKAGMWVLRASRLGLPLYSFREGLEAMVKDFRWKS